MNHDNDYDDNDYDDNDYDDNDYDDDDDGGGDLIICFTTLDSQRINKGPFSKTLTAS